MPELPEVETTRRSIEPYLVGQTVASAVVRQPKLRLPVTRGLPAKLSGAVIHRVSRRAKYLLVETDRGTLLIHLGMTGSLGILARPVAPGKHDHFDLWLANGNGLRFNDPRRFGCVLLTGSDPARHRLLRGLGPEPMAAGFDGDYLYHRSRGIRAAVKSMLMDGRIVVGVGNIYASESLFRAGIHPARAAGRIGLDRMRRLANAVKAVLADAIRAGGTTLRDFHDSDGRPGYFSQQLLVYGREDLPCVSCSTPLRRRVIGQRSSFFCPSCQR